MATLPNNVASRNFLENSNNGRHLGFTGAPIITGATVQLYSSLRVHLVEGSRARAKQSATQVPSAL